MRNFLRSITPDFLLDLYRRRKKKKRNWELDQFKTSGKILTRDELVRQFKSIGIEEGDTLLVHSSLSKIGYVEGGAKTVVEALIDAVGEKGNLLMPTSPNASLQLDYIRSLEVFDVSNDPSRLGAISEYFRKLPKVVRSAHPTEPVACLGPDSAYYTKDHFGRITPYDRFSPFYRVSERGGKILYLGVTLDNAGTNLHTLEDAVDNFPYPVYASDVFTVAVRFPDGHVENMDTKVHNPQQSSKRKCDGLIPMFIEKDVMKEFQIGEARVLLTDARKMMECMIFEYQENGITMYTPEGRSS